MNWNILVAGTTSNADVLHTHDPAELFTQGSGNSNYAIVLLPFVPSAATDGGTSWRMTEGGTLTNAQMGSGSFFVQLTSAGSTGNGGVITIVQAGGAASITNAPPLDGLNVSDRMYWVWNVFLDNTTGYDFWFGFTNDGANPNAPVAGDEYAAFHENDGTFSAETSDGAVIESTNIVITKGQINTFTIFRDSSSVKFYVNGTLGATHSTRIPTSATAYGFAFGQGNTTGSEAGAEILSPVTLAVFKTDYATAW